MSDLAVRWVAVAPSAWQRRLRCFAFALSAGVLASLPVVHLFDSPAGALAAGAVALLGVAAVMGLRAPQPARFAWSVASNGDIAVRYDDRVFRDAVVVFVSPAFIVLRVGRRSLEIWRDATPIEAFRRLSVALRWRARRGAGATLTVIKPSDAAERT